MQETQAEFARDHPAAIDAELTVLRVNPTDNAHLPDARSIILVANPGELYSGLGMQIKEQSPVDQTFVLNLTNSSCTWVLTKDIIRL